MDSDGASNTLERSSFTRRVRWDARNGFTRRARWSSYEILRSFDALFRASLVLKDGDAPEEALLTHGIVPHTRIDPREARQEDVDRLRGIFGGECDDVLAPGEARHLRHVRSPTPRGQGGRPQDARTSKQESVGLRRHHLDSCTGVRARSYGVATAPNRKY